MQIDTAIGKFTPDELELAVKARRFNTLGQGALIGALKGLNEVDRSAFLQLSTWVLDRIPLDEKFRGKLLALVRSDSKALPNTQSSTVATDPGQFRQLLESVNGRNLKITFKTSAESGEVAYLLGMDKIIFVLRRVDDMNLRVVMMSGRWEAIPRTVEVVVVRLDASNIDWFLGRLARAIEKLEIVP